MDIKIKDRFIKAWGKYFPGSELPIVCFYSDDLGSVEFAKRPKPSKKGYTCIFSQIALVRRGYSLAFNMENLGCYGCTFSFGFNIDLLEEVKNYMCNVEHIKKSPRYIESIYKDFPPLKAPGRYIVFKRWDRLKEQDDPQVVIFFVTPDVASGLHGLANFRATTPHGVILPFGTACDAIVRFPLLELKSEEPKAVIGSMDPFARIYFKPNTITFAAPWPKFLDMLESMDESFLETEGWLKVRSRIQRTK